MLIVERRTMWGVLSLRSVLAFSILHAAFGIAIVSAQDPPVLTAPVNDFANVIDADSERVLDRRIRALQAASGDVVVVATVRTTAPYDIESYALKMFENGGRGIGARGKDNGLLIVVAVDDRRARIETGYDLEAFITDGFAGDTIRSVMRPRFAAGDYSGGILAATTRVINRIAERRGTTLQDVPRRHAPAEPRGSGLPVGLIVVIALIVLSLLGRMGGPRRRRRRGPWIVGGPWSGWDSGVGPFGGGRFGGGFGGFGGGGFGGGGFGGFGGGRSGGGGASGSW